jgi:hypothetical protein
MLKMLQNATQSTKVFHSVPAGTLLNFTRSVLQSRKIVPQEHFWLRRSSGIRSPRRHRFVQEGLITWIHSRILAGAKPDRRSVPAGTLRTGRQKAAHRSVGRMFLQEHWTRFAHQFTCLHSTSSLN